MADPLHVVLKPALEAARRALADLDADQVPADLRRVYTATGGRLPPPLAEALVSGLDKYPWLRESTLEHWSDADPGDEGIPGAAAAFVVREGEWARHLARAVADVATESETARSNALVHRLADAEGLAHSLRSRLESERRTMGDELARVREERDVARAANKASAAAESREIERVETRAAEDRALAADLAAQLASVRAELEASNESLRDERRARSAAEHLVSESESGAGWWADDPIEMAIRLDDVAVMNRLAPEVAVTITAGGSDVSIPSTVAPDGAGAIDWLLYRSDPTTVYVDGYNAGYRMTGTPDDPSGARDRLLPLIDRLARLAAGPLGFIVVFDGLAGPDDTPPPGGRVRVVFTSGQTADDEIAEGARAAGDPVVVISDDREVRESVEASGGSGIWSAALVEWAARRR